MLGRSSAASRGAGPEARGRPLGSTGHRRRGWLIAGVMTSVALAVAGCGSSSGGSGGGSSGSGNLTIADVAPFTGVDAALGPTYLVSCDAATNAINTAGGVLGHKLSCKAVDTRGDPADAVPAVRQMYASTSNLALVIGCTSDEAASVVPLFGANKTVSFCMTGQSEFDHVKFPYFYRLVPPDLSESYAMIAIAQHHTYKRIALAFGNDIGSQTFVAPAIAAIKAAGMTLVSNQTLDLHAATFRTEAARIVASKPDVILTEALGPPEASFLSEVKQLSGGKVIPVIGTSATISPDWYKSVAAAVGPTVLSQNFSADNLVVETSGSAFQVFSKAIFAEKGKVGSTGNFATYLTAPGAVHLYDGINLAALAMLASHSTSANVFKPFIEKIGDGVAGATVVYSFAEGAAALKQGKQIRYEGPGGPTSFDAYHDSTGIFQVDTYSPAGQVNVTGNLSASELRALGL
jgi:ABC-type branched-subunit amino acid transport system substrate-binding protein